jgi:hypothetical protein
MRISFGGSITVPSQSERWFSEIRASRAFTRGGNLGASVGNFSEFQLLNPAASGKTIDIYRMLADTVVNDGLYMRTHNTALATLVGTGINLQAGGPAGVGELRTAQPAALDGTAVSLINTAAFAVVEMTSVWSWELDPGEGVLVATGNVNEAAACLFYWNES